MLPEGAKFCPGKILSGKILSGKNPGRGLKIGGFILDASLKVAGKNPGRCLKNVGVLFWTVHKKKLSSIIGVIHSAHWSKCTKMCDMSFECGANGPG